MAKWAEYLISGVWKKEKNGSKYVSHVMLHKDSDSTFAKGVKTSKEDVIQMIRNKVPIVTMTWSYETGTWQMGAVVEIEVVGGEDFLKTNKDASPSDNILNLPPMTAYF